ncbi:hypothetical protein OEZ86_003575 [Tetradesmus obliquus]|nr:hypothetical protein OEZ86_003575 [Tetradesmus obliquus]
MVGADDASDSEHPAPRRRRKGQPMQAAASSEEPARGVGRPGAGSGRAGRADQDSKLGDADPQVQPKRFRATPEDEPAAFGSASQDAEQNGQEQLPAKRKRTQLFSVKDIMAVDRTEGAALPPAGAAAAAAAAAQHGYAAASSTRGSSRQQTQAGAAYAAAAAAAGGPSPGHSMGRAAGGAAPAAAAAAAAAAEFNPDLLPKGVARDMALQRERRCLAEAAQAELGADSLGPDSNVATLVQRILKCGVLTRKAVEYRKRAKGMGPSDYNRGVITSAGLIRCGCHGADITMSEFEQHSNSQIHRPAEYIFIKSIDMSLKSFALLVLTKPIDSNLWYCLACSDGGELLCCDGCPAAFHTACLGGQAGPQPNSEWLCAECLASGRKPRWSGRGPTRRFTPLAGAAGSGMRRGSGSSAGGSRGGMRGSSSDGGGMQQQQQLGMLLKQQGSISGGPASLVAGGAAAAAGYGPPGSYSHSSGGYALGPGGLGPGPAGFYETDEPHMGAYAAAAAGLGGPMQPHPGSMSPSGGWGRQQQQQQGSMYGGASGPGAAEVYSQGPGRFGAAAGGYDAAAAAAAAAAAGYMQPA